MILLWTSCFSTLKSWYLATHTQPLCETKVGGRCHALVSKLVWKRPSTQCTGGWMSPENVSPIGVSTLDCPAHSKSLYQLPFPSRTCCAVPTTLSQPHVLRCTDRPFPAACVAFYPAHLLLHLLFCYNQICVFSLNFHLPLQMTM
jgi:hypothetical protein